MSVPRICEFTPTSEHDGSDSHIINQGTYGLILDRALPEVPGDVDHLKTDCRYTKLAARNDTKHEYNMGQCAQSAAGRNGIATLQFEREVTAVEEKNLIESKNVGENGLKRISLSTIERRNAKKLKAKSSLPWDSDEVCLGIGDLDIAEGSLADCMSKIPEPELFEQLRLLCSTMAQLHAGGVFHRDIKLGNILAYNVAGTWTLKLGDFGMAVCTNGDHGHRQFNPTYFYNDVGFSYYLYPWSIVPAVWDTSKKSIKHASISPPSLTLLNPTSSKLQTIHTEVMERLRTSDRLRSSDRSLHALLHDIGLNEHKQSGGKFQSRDVTQAQLAMATQCDWFSIFLVLAACIHVFKTPTQRRRLEAFGRDCLHFQITNDAEADRRLEGVFSKAGEKSEDVHAIPEQPRHPPPHKNGKRRGSDGAKYVYGVIVQSDGCARTVDSDRPLSGAVCRELFEREIGGPIVMVKPDDVKSSERFVAFCDENGVAKKLLRNDFAIEMLNVLGFNPVYTFGPVLFANINDGECIPADEVVALLALAREINDNRWNDSDSTDSDTVTEKQSIDCIRRLGAAWLCEERVYTTQKRRLGTAERIAV